MRASGGANDVSMLEFAGLGCRRGGGESLLSWACAGPLGSAGAESVGLSLDTICERGRLFCPACRVREFNQHRWYSREAWDHPGHTVCDVHALPLLQSDTPPTCLRSRRWPADLRTQFRALGNWEQMWARAEAVQLTGRVRTLELALVRALLARTDPRVPFSAALASGQWSLWLTGWPVPSGPKFPATRCVLPARQPDRMALMALAWKAHMSLALGIPSYWPALELRHRAYRLLQGRLAAHCPAWSANMQLCFRKEA